MATKGTCSLCLEYGKLTFEHIPPRRVFNDKPTIAHTLYGLKLGSNYSKEPPLLISKRGLGKTTLCEGCNGRTAALYGNAFSEWTLQCLRYAEKIRSVENGLLFPFHIEPLNVLKQIIVMAIAASGLKTSAESIDALRHFVRNKDSTTLPEDYHVRTYFNPGDLNRARIPQLTQNRLSEMCAVLDTRTGKSVFVVAEIAFPPMGYVVFSSPEGEHQSMDFAELCDIRMFQNHHFGQRAIKHLAIPARYPFGPVPGYYPSVIDGTTKYLSDNYVLLT